MCSEIEWWTHMLSTSRGKGSALVSIISLDLAPEDTLSSATRLALVGKQEEWQKLAVGTSLFSTSYGGTTYLLPAILPSHEGYLLSNFYLNYIFKLKHKIIGFYMLLVFVMPSNFPHLLPKTGPTEGWPCQHSVMKRGGVHGVPPSNVRLLVTGIVWEKRGHLLQVCIH